MRRHEMAELGLGVDQGFAAGEGGRRRSHGRGPSVVRQCRALDHADRRRLAGFAGAVWQMELGVPAIQSVVRSSFLVRDNGPTPALP